MKIFYQVPFENHPINEYGDIKTGKYVYHDIAKQSNEPIFNIERVTTSKISENIRNSISPTLYVGFIDFEVSKPRFPRLY